MRAPDWMLEPGSDFNGWLVEELRSSTHTDQAWRASNLLTRQTAELRTYNPELIPQSMVLREVDFLTRLRSPYFPRFLGHFPYNGTYVVATRWINGCNLTELLEMNKRGLPPAMAEVTANSLLAALGELHALAGVPVHRALSPRTVLLDEAGNLYLTGMAFVESSESLALSDTRDFVFGDVRYQAPEVFDDPAAASVRSNIYSAGALIFELFAGRRPFDSYETTAERWYADIAYQHHSLPAPQLSDYAPWLPERTVTAVDLALSKDPADRPASCAVFAEILGCYESAVLGNSLPVEPSPVKSEDTYDNRRRHAGWLKTGNQWS